MRHTRALFATLSAVALSVAVAPAAARAESCQMASYGKFPIEMVGTRALTTLKVNGQDARFIVDTGGFFSMMPRAMAAGMGLQMDPAPNGFYVSGIGGDARVEVTTVRQLGLLNTTIRNVMFIVGGSDAGGGILGDNVLGIGDLDTDLSNGLLQLLKVTGCRNKALAYWAQNGNWQEAALLPAEGEHDLKARVSVLINGHKVIAELDTGATATLLTRRAALQAGIDMNAPGVTEVGQDGGIGSRTVRSWIAPVDKFEVGSEAIQHSKMRIIDGTIGGPSGPDMLLGIDFFLAHHLLISFSQRKLYFTYNGGRMFTGSAPPKAAAAPAGAAEPKDAAGLAARGEGHLARGEAAAALTDLDAALALEPGQARYRLARARARLASHQLAGAQSDLDAALQADPALLDARLLRAQVRLHARDSAGAAADLAAARAGARAGSPESLTIAGTMIDLDQPGDAVALISDWIRLHPEDGGLGVALNMRAWARALANREIEAALADSQRALRLSKDNPGYLDTLALLQVRQGKMAEAEATYRRVLPRLAKTGWTHWGLALALAAQGKSAEAKAEFAAAIALDAALPARAARLGLTPTKGEGLF
ncbi:MAG: retroviral-like aspartic protease family protein [Proteobacteria bacterium]|nr:retroviral-like aspartic protease family protein [Pseudomonadota bacterium]